MIVTITWWDLSQSKQSISSLNTYMKTDGIGSWDSVQGLELKFWISDSITNRWGAVMVWESEDYLEQSLPPNRAMELIGYAPTERVKMNIESIIGDLDSSKLTKNLV